jgi:hypothetical protein
MASVPRQVLNELGELGKSILTEAVKAPGSIAGEAIPGTKPSTTPQQKSTSEDPNKNPSPLDDMMKETDQSRLLGIARKALEYLAVPRTREPTVRERHDQEDEAIREQKEKEAKIEAQMAPVAAPKGKVRGDLFGAKQSTEKSPNVRQD